MLRMRSEVLAPAVAAALIALGAGPGRAAEFVVSPPFKIQDAVDLALINPDAFDVIRVNSGTYAELVTLDFSGTNQTGITLIKNTTKRPIITGGVEIRDARVVTLQGFQVRSDLADATAAIRIRDCVGVAILDCIGQNGDYGGVDAADTDEVILDGCTFSNMDEASSADGGFGVKIIGRCAHAIRNSTFDGNEYRGIWVEADRTQIRNCSASNMATAAANAGIVIEGLQNSVRDCDVEDSEGLGIIVEGVCVVRNSLIRNNAKVGVRFGSDGVIDYSGGSIFSCTVSNNGGVGVVVNGDQDGVEVRNNVINGNEGAGVRLFSDWNVVRDNTIRITDAASIPGHGLLIEAGSTGNCVEDNFFKDNDGTGIQVEGDDNYLYLNDAKGNDGFVKAGGTSGNTGRANLTAGGTNDFP